MIRLINNQQKQREANMELLRIVAMFLVLAVHTNDAALGELMHDDLTANVLNGSLWLNIVPTSVMPRMWSYLSPIVVIESMALLLLFSKLSFSSRLVNTLAAGSFGVFLLHMHPVVYPYYTTYAARIWEQYNGNLWVYLAVIMGYMTAIYLIGWALDMVWHLPKNKLKGSNADEVFFQWRSRRLVK